MYLARHVGRWSTTVIGRFYNGRDHSTVSHVIQRIEAMRESDSDVDALISELKQELAREHNEASSSEESNRELESISRSKQSVDELAELVAERVCAYLERRMQHLS